MNYGYNFDIIDMSLKKTTSKTNPNFNYIDSIISDWNKNNLKTKDEIMLYEVERKKKFSKTTKNPVAIPQQGNFEQRKYEEDFLNSFYENA